MVIEYKIGDLVKVVCTTFTNGSLISSTNHSGILSEQIDLIKNQTVCKIIRIYDQTGESYYPFRYKLEPKDKSIKLRYALLCINKELIPFKLSWRNKIEI